MEQTFIIIIWGDNYRAKTVVLINLIKQLPWWGPVLEAYGINSADDMGRIMAGDTWLWEKPQVFEDQWTKAAEENGLKLLKLSFEDIIKDKETYIRQIADFVGLEISRPMDEIIADTSVERTINRIGFSKKLQ